MNSLESRRQRLIEESELNRARLILDLNALRADLGVLTDRTKSFGSIATSAAVLVAGLAAFKRGKSGPAGGRPTRVQRLVSAAGLISTLWLAFRPPGRDQKDK